MAQMFEAPSALSSEPLLEMATPSLRMALGDALSMDQVTMMLGSCAGWMVLYFITRALSPRLPNYKLMSSNDRFRFNFTVPALIHAVLASALALRVILTPDDTLVVDKIYGLSPRAQFSNALSAGYFMFDFGIAISVEKVNPGFVVHSVACFLSYFLGQRPFLNYTGCWFLLFELSTPFLLMRNLLLHSHNKTHPAYLQLQKVFAVMFFVARIGMGIPVSVLFWRDMLRLLRDGDGHSTFVIGYYLLANITLNSLNVVWFIAIVQKGMRVRAETKKQKAVKGSVNGSVDGAKDTKKNA